MRVPEPDRVHAADVAGSLDERRIDVWWLPWRRGDGRNALLALLAAYLGMPADAVRLSTGPHGRPRLAAPAAALDFNWSHSGGRAVAVLARGLPRVGVDIEYPRARHDPLLLARRFFAPSEQAQLERLAPAARASAFIRLWTAKEAVLKAQGRGLAYGLDRVSFVLDETGVHAAHFVGAVGAAETWHLRHWQSSDAAVVSLAWQGPPRALRHFAPVHGGPELSAAAAV